MKNYDFQEKQCQITDPIENYFECISTCNIGEGMFISRCGELFRKTEP